MVSNGSLNYDTHAPILSIFSLNPSYSIYCSPQQTAQYRKFLTSVTQFGRTIQGGKVRQIRFVSESQPKEFETIYLEYFEQVQILLAWTEPTAHDSNYENQGINVHDSVLNSNALINNVNNVNNNLNNNLINNLNNNLNNNIINNSINGNLDLSTQLDSSTNISNPIPKTISISIPIQNGNQSSNQSTNQNTHQGNTPTHISTNPSSSNLTSYSPNSPKISPNLSNGEFNTHEQNSSTVESQELKHHIPTSNPHPQSQQLKINLVSKWIQHLTKEQIEQLKTLNEHQRFQLVREKILALEES